MVVPTYRAFFEARSKNRYGENQLVAKGIDAANLLFHIREHVPSSDRPSRTELQRQYPDYGLVADIANAAKHRLLDRNNPRISDASQIGEIMVVTEYRDDQGVYTSAQAKVRVKLDDGSEHDLAQLLHSVFSMWCIQLQSLGIGNFKNPEGSWSDSHVERIDAKDAPIEQLSGEARKLSFEFRVFDYSAGISKPRDLTGSSVSMNVYKYPESVPITLQSKVDPEVSVEVDIPLRQDQAEEYIKLSDPSEQDAFMVNLIQSDEDLQSRVTDALVASGVRPDAERD